ncbi:lipoprotein signal peptidase [Methylomicrobium album BG8]|uniref:Lipoprotein signal peptidase n=2 Tax=Methylomicrobium album TaxID=39775 RepID=H8GFU4_METAL|nr:lipoprotein signal peptidase [Methylomicrobium album BG8]
MMPMLKWLWLTLFAVLLDQGSKLAIDASMHLYESIPVIPYLNLTYVHNTGAAFSFLSEAGGWQRWFFSGLALFIGIGITVWLARLHKHETLLAAALSLILGGAIGNLIDRVAYGYVIDFIDVYYGNSHFPFFNIADAAINLGVFLMLAESFGWFGTARKV